MPEFIITSPDGKKFRVTAPEGAEEGQLQPAQPTLSERAQGTWKQLNKPGPGNQMSATEQFQTGFMDPFVGVEEMSRHAVGDPEFDDLVKTRNADIAKRMPPGFSLPRAVGGAVSPLNLMAGAGAGGAAAAGRPIIGGLTAGAAGAVTQPTSGQGDYWTEKGEQAIEGAAGGGALGVAGKLAGGAGRALTPFPIDSRRQQMVRALQREGIEPTAAQQTGSEFLNFAESHLGMLPGAGGEKLREQGFENFTRAALKRAGIDSERVTDEAMNRGFAANGARFDRLARQTEMHGDRQLAQDLHDTLQEYWSQTQPTMRRPYVENTINEVADAVIANGNRLDGHTYQSLSSRVRRYERETTDPEYRRALGGIRAALDDAMERSIAATRPDLAGQWREVRNQYRNLLVIEQAATGGSKQAKQELLSPAALRRALVNQNRRDYARGQGDFAQLARAGEVVMGEPANSGTPARLATEKPVRSAIKGLTVGRALMSPTGQAYLKSQLWNRPIPGAVPNAVPALSPAVGAALGQQDSDAMAAPQDALVR